MSVSALGLAIKTRRKALRISQADLASLARISINTLYKIERGEANPTIDVIEKIADVLGFELTLAVKKINLDRL